MRKLPRGAKPLLIALALAGCATAPSSPPVPAEFSFNAPDTPPTVRVRVRAETGDGCERLRGVAGTVLKGAAPGPCGQDLGPSPVRQSAFRIVSEPIALYGGVVRVEVESSECEDVRESVARHMRKMTARATAGQCGKP